MYFRNKPVVIEALPVPYAEYADNPYFAFKNSPDWLLDAFLDGTIVPEFRTEDYWYYRIRTLEGDHMATPDDWIIRDVAGDLYPCKADIFVRTYDPVE